MEELLILDENWHVLLSLFPKNWAELAKERGAMVRKLRAFPSEDAVMRTLLIHIAQGYSLRETTVKAKAAGISAVSAIAFRGSAPIRVKIYGFRANLVFKP